MKKSILAKLVSIADTLDKAGLKKQADIIDKAIQAASEKHQGYSNYDTWHAALMINNTQSMYKQLREHLEKGTSQQALASALKKILSDHAKSSKDKMNINPKKVNWDEIAKDEMEGHEYDKGNN